VFAAAYGHAAGRIGDAMVETSALWKLDIPPLNSIIVNRRTGVPGDGCDWYLKKFLRVRRALSDADRANLAKATHEKVHNFRHWDRLLREYGMTVVGPGPTPKVRRRTKLHHSGWSNEGESQAHKRLADLIAKEPALLGLKRKLPKGIRECYLASADRPDVVFRLRHETLAVEVKSYLSNDADLERGVFQCVKYRAVLKAEQTALGQVPNSWAVLVTGRPIPDSVREFARLLDVRCIYVSEPSA
jgi:hypothetical protein